MTYDQKLEHVLRWGTAVFAEKGCGAAAPLPDRGPRFKIPIMGLRRWVQREHHLRAPENERGSQ